MYKSKLNFSPITSVENTFFKDVVRIVVNGGGGMGGSREEILCEEIIEKKDNLGFMVVKELRTNEIVKINPMYIGTIRTLNVTKVHFTHKNPNFPSGKRTEWYSHKVGTEVTFMTEEDYKNSSLLGGCGLTKIYESNYNY